MILRVGDAVPPNYICINRIICERGDLSLNRVIFQEPNFGSACKWMGLCI